MNSLKEKCISSKLIYNGKVINLYSDEALLPNGRTAVREYITHNGAVCVVPITEANEIIMVRQYRYPFAQVTLEIPAGKLEKGEDIYICAQRELSEETGASAGDLKYIGEYYPSPAILNEVLYMFTAKHLTYKSMHTDEDEFIQTEKIPFDKLVKMILNGEIKDGKTQAAVLKAYLLEQNTLLK